VSLAVAAPQGTTAAAGVRPGRLPSGSVRWCAFDSTAADANV